MQLIMLGINHVTFLCFVSFTIQVWHYSIQFKLLN